MKRINRFAVEGDTRGDSPDEVVVTGKKLKPKAPPKKEQTDPSDSGDCSALPDLTIKIGAFCYCHC
jgi:hypothetical protein